MELPSQGPGTTGSLGGRPPQGLERPALGALPLAPQLRHLSVPQKRFLPPGKLLFLDFPSHGSFLGQEELPARKTSRVHHLWMGGSGGRGPQPGRYEVWSNSWILRAKL